MGCTTRGATHYDLFDPNVICIQFRRHWHLLPVFPEDFLFLFGRNKYLLCPLSTEQTITYT
jgi:hypothetical protein